jgi:hypothetical protein
MFDPHLTAAEWYLGSLGSEWLPEFARTALEQGYDGKHLAQLAVLVKPTKRDVDALIAGALRELAVTFPLTKNEAALWMLTSVKARASSVDITSANLVGKLLSALPELEKQYTEELKEYYGLPGNYWVFAVILKPVLIEQIAAGEITDFVGRCSAFIEQVCSGKDLEAINVLWIEVFEWLVNSQAGELKFLWPTLGPSTRVKITEVATRRRKTKNLP